MKSINQKEVRKVKVMCSRLSLVIFVSIMGMLALLVSSLSRDLEFTEQTKEMHSYVMKNQETTDIAYDKAGPYTVYHNVRWDKQHCYDILIENSTGKALYYRKVMCENN